MGDLLLNSGSVILCTHGGVVTHVGTTNTTYRISGRPPMLQTDVFLVAGCPFANPCNTIQWLTASTMLIVKGIPVLTYTSVGMCMGANGVANGPAVVAATQLGEREPDTFTSINE
jgi:hypothetical protein